MSIASEIQRLQGVRTNIFDAITNKGVTVPSGAKLADCPDLIASITGGGGVKGDIVITDSAKFKNFFPLNLNTSYDGISSDIIYNGNMFNYYNPLLINADFRVDLSDSFEIAVTFKKSQYTSIGRCLFGCLSSYFNNFTLEYNGEFFFVGIPYTGYDWTMQFSLTVSLTTDKWYTAILKQSSGTLYLECYDENNILVASTTKSDYSLISKSSFTKMQLGGANRSSTIHWNGLIDLKKTYIKLNGQTLWGVERVP